MRAVVDHGNLWEIGAGVSLTAVGEVIGESCPVFGKILRRCGHRHFRNRSTLGGYLSTSPSAGEFSPVLMALDARVRIVSIEGERDVPIAQFLEAPGGQNLRPIEVIGSVLIPRFTGEVLASRGCRVRFCSAYKAAPRREAIPASITGSFAVEIDERGAVSHAWIAYSGLGDRPVRARETEVYLSGKPWNEQTVLSVLSMLSREIVVPNDPAAAGKIRSYRRQLVITLLQKFFYEHPRPDGPPVELGAIHDYLQPNAPFFRANSGQRI
jgi:xanthine dehydrogenase iron-sulfur cluster and FAD-binding subunit A